MSTAERIYDARVEAVRAGAFAHLEAQPIVPAKASRTPKGGGGRVKGGKRIDLPWEDAKRGYKPGQMTDEDWIKDVVQVLLGEPGAKLGQSIITDRVAVLHGIEPDTAGQRQVARRVSASLYWLRVVGAVAARERKKPAPKRNPTVFWQLVELPA